LTECSVDEATLQFQYQTYTWSSDRVCWACDSDSVPEEWGSGGEASTGGERQYELICVEDGIPGWVVAIIVITLLIFACAVGACCFFRKRKITVKVDVIGAAGVVDKDCDGDVDAADAIKTFDKDKDGKLDCGELQGMIAGAGQERTVTLEGTDTKIDVGRTTVATN